MTTDIALFFEPIEEEHASFQDGTLGAKISVHSSSTFPEVKKGTVAVFGVLEDRRTNASSGSSAGLTAIRSKLYALKNHFDTIDIVDLGNIRPGETVEDTYYAVTSSITEVIKKGGVVLMLGGGQDLSYANYLAYEKLEQAVNLVTVDSRFDIGDVEDEVNSDKFLQKIILHQPNVLFNYSNIGYQTHHTLPKEIELMNKMYFDIYRLGEVQQNLEGVEPVVRNADMVSFDLSSVRSSDLTGNYRAEPNGFYGEEGCAIARYAGLSDKLSSIGFFDYDSSGDRDKRGAHLVAQMIWYFLWGIANRKGDYPFSDKNDYLKYTVAIKNGQYDIVFYKSQKSDRWWMEVPYPSKRGVKYERHFMVPCSYMDYQNACNEEIPDRWWQTFQKLG